MLRKRFTARVTLVIRERRSDPVQVLAVLVMLYTITLGLHPLKTGMYYHRCSCGDSWLNVLSLRCLLTSARLSTIYPLEPSKQGSRQPRT